MTASQRKAQAVTVHQSHSSSPDRSGWVALSLAMGLVALVTILGGGAILAAHARHADDDGFYATASKQLTTPTTALVSSDLDLDVDGAGWLFRSGRVASIRITATGTNARPIFIGVAPRTQVRSYLDAVAHDEVTDFEIDPFTVTTARRAGSRTPTPPTDNDLWTASATGAGKQVLTWPMTGGTWEVVVMNADGTPNVETDLTLGAKVPAAFWLGGTLLTIGALLTLGLVLVVYRGARRRRRR